MELKFLYLAVIFSKCAVRTKVHPASLRPTVKANVSYNLCYALHFNNYNFLTFSKLNSRLNYWSLMNISDDQKQFSVTL